MSLEEYFGGRRIWMSLAILWIVLYHTTEYVSYGILDPVAKLGYSGCDIFFFASGIGMYLSLEKHPSVPSFYRRRALRVYPAYWCFLPFWIAFRYLTRGLTLWDVLGNLTGFWALYDQDRAFNWYFSWMLVFYLLTPLLKKIVDVVVPMGGRLLFFALLGSIAAVGILAPLPASIIIGFSRLPVYLLGLYFGWLYRRHSRLSRGTMGVLFFGIAAGYGLCLLALNGENALKTWESGMLWFPLLLSTPGLCLVMTLVLGKTKDVWLWRVLSDATLEIYFVHILLYEIYTEYFLDRGILSMRLWHWLVIWVLVGVLVAGWKWAKKRLRGDAAWGDGSA